MLFTDKIALLLREFVKVKKQIITKIMITAKNHYKDKFVEGNGNWEDAEWKQPQRKTNPSSTTAKRNSATLVQTGALSRSVQARKQGDTIIISSNLPYAKRHNEGIKMPKRTFIGMEKKLKQKIEKVIKENLNPFFE